MVDTFLDRLIIPSPPWRTGRAIRSLSRCLKVFCPVRAGKELLSNCIFKWLQKFFNVWDGP